MAGISCCWGLLKKNPHLKIVVVDSNSRLGGRLLSHTFGDISIKPDVHLSSVDFELGGAFLSGTVKTNPLWALLHNLHYRIDDVKGGY